MTSSDCVAKRQRTLRYLVDDHDRTWVKAHAPAEAYASGVRLFALKSKKKDLTCDELAHGKNEADRAPGRSARSRQSDAGAGLARHHAGGRSFARTGRRDEAPVPQSMSRASDFRHCKKDA